MEVRWNYRGYGIGEVDPFVWTGGLAVAGSGPPSLADTAALRQWLEGLGPWAPLVFMALMATAIVVSPLPSLPLDVVAGALFGPVLGTVYAVTGATAGATVAFLLARGLGGRLLERLVGGHASFCRRCSTRIMFWVVLVSRLVPVVSFDLVSFGAGVTSMSLGAFVLATAVGMVPLTALYVSAGGVLVPAEGWSLVAGAGVVALMLLLPRLVERFGPARLRRMLRHAQH